MMVRIGNFFFHWRNVLFPLAYFLLLVPSPKIFSSPYVAALVGFSIAVLGQALRATTIGFEYIIRGGKNRRVYAERLVQGGMFAHSRNPLYLGNYLIVVGVGVTSNSIVFLSCVVPVFAFCYAAIIAAEENYLRGKFGEEFEQYCARVNRIIPNLAGFSRSIEGMSFNWRRLITAEYGSTFMWLGGILLITMKNLLMAGGYEQHREAILFVQVLIVCVIAAYALARYLKKSGRLKAKRTV
jgi:protein-S-isoprenylcysteine O-methyltransferase Ste14